MSAIIISSILMVIVIGGNLTTLFTRFNILDSELKERSEALADSCIDSLLLEIANDQTYAGPKTVTVEGASTCQIQAATNPTGNPRIFPIRASFQNSYTDIFVTVDIDTLALTSIKEVGGF